MADSQSSELLFSPRIGVSAAARLVGTSEQSIRRAADAGLLPVERVGSMRIFRIADVKRFKASRMARCE